MLYKSIYNYYGYLISTYMPDIKHYAYYFGQEFDDNQINAYPAIYIELNTVNIADLQDNVQNIQFEAQIHIFGYVTQSFAWTDKNKNYSGDFLDLIDRVNSTLVLNNDVPAEYLTCRPTNVRRTGIRIIPNSDKVKESIITFRFEVIDYSLISEQSYAIAENTELEIKYIQTNG